MCRVFEIARLDVLKDIRARANYKVLNEWQIKYCVSLIAEQKNWIYFLVGE